MYLDLLRKIMPPPVKPKDNGNRDMFSEVKSILKITLPEDYCQFIIEYGQGMICEELYIFSPFSSSYYNLMDQITLMGKAYLYLKFSSLKYNFGDVERKVGYPFNFFPEADGLLPFGLTDTGYEFYWKMSENSEWSIVVYPDSPDYLEYDMCMSEFLYRLLSGQLSCDGLEEMCCDGITFRPF